VTFEAVLKLFSAGLEVGELRMGDPVELDPEDQKQTPTVKLPYGDIPVTQLAAGMRRILALAYFVVWAWRKYQSGAKQYRVTVENRIVLIIDEIEAHLHPKWQRLILPALLRLQEALGNEVQIQFLIATHSPFVLASLEPYFDAAQDQLFHLDLEGDQVKLKTEAFMKRGSINAWLTSEVFELAQARSIEAEQAILDARRIQKESTPDPKKIQEISDRLVKYLAELDEFWPLWTYFARKNGAEL
jgi:predicted ATP-binding protein involved in virulence